MKALAVAIVVLAALPASAQRPGWEVRIPERVEIAAGTAGTLPIAIALDRGLVVSKDADVILDLKAPTAVTVKKRRFGRADAVDPGADAPRFDIAVKSDLAGDHAVEVRLRFWLCGARTCRPVDLRRKAIVAVTSAAGHQPP